MNNLSTPFQNTLQFTKCEEGIRHYRRYKDMHSINNPRLVKTGSNALLFLAAGNLVHNIFL